MSTGWKIGALDLRKVGYNIETVDGWDSFPGTRVARNEHGFRHGERRGTRVFYKPRPLTITMAILGTANPLDPPGLSPEEYTQLHLDAIFGSLHSPNSGIIVTKTIAGVDRISIVGVDDAFPVNQRTRGSRAMVMQFTMSNPFWGGAAYSGAVTTGDFNNLGNAPINDTVITFGGAATITNGDDVVQASSACVVNLAEDTVTVGGVPSNGLVESTSPWVLELQPGLNSLVISGSVSLSGRYPWF